MRRAGAALAGPGAEVRPHSVQVRDAYGYGAKTRFINHAKHIDNAEV